MCSNMMALPIFKGFILLCVLHCTVGQRYSNNSVLTLFFNFLRYLCFHGRVLSNFILISSFAIQVDSYRKLGLQRRRSKDFAINNERLYRGKAKIPPNSIEQREEIRGFSSLGKTMAKSQRLVELFKLEAKNKDEYALNSFEILPRKRYQTFQSTRNEHPVRTSTTAAQRSEKVNKDYIFRDIVRTDRSNSYGKYIPFCFIIIFLSLTNENFTRGIN